MQLTCQKAEGAKLALCGWGLLSARGFETLDGQRRGNQIEFSISFWFPGPTFRRNHIKLTIKLWFPDRIFNRICASSWSIFYFKSEGFTGIGSTSWPIFGFETQFFHQNRLKLLEKFSISKPSFASASDRDLVLGWRTWKEDSIWVAQAASFFHKFFCVMCVNCN